MDRLFGGNPLLVLLRLAVISLIVGVVLHTLDITPRNLIGRLQDIGTRIWELGFGAFHWAGGYLLLGAMVVLPIWLIIRFFGVFRNRDSKARH